MKHQYTIQALNNALGTPVQADGVMMIFCQAVAIDPTFALGTSYLLESMEDLDALGIDAAYDTDNDVYVFGQVSEFYQQALDGAKLWLVGVPTNTTYAAYVVTDAYKNLIFRTRYDADMQPTPENRAKIVGLCYAPPSVTQTAAAFPADVTAAITAAQLTQQAMFQTGTPYSVIIDGYNMSANVAPSALPSEQNNTAFAVSLCITGLTPNGVSAVGFALGRFARISVGHGCGDVQDGPLNTQTAYLTNSVIVKVGDNMVLDHIMTVLGGAVTYNAVVYQPGQTFAVVAGHLTYTTTAGGYVADNCTPITGLTQTQIDDLGSKQLFFLRYWQDYTGLYWNDGATCTGEDKAFSSQEYNRVVNRLAGNVIFFLSGKNGTKVALQRGTPDASLAWIQTQQATFYTTYIEPLREDGGTGDLTDAALTIDGTGYLGTKKLKYKLKVEPTIIMGGADGTVEFVSTL